MRSMLRSLALILVAATNVVSAPSDSGWVRVLTQPAGLTVFVDGRAVGPSPVGPIACRVGTVVVQVLHGSPHQWGAVSAAESVVVRNADTVEVRVVGVEPVLVTSDGAPMTLVDAHGTVVSTPFWWRRDRLSELSVAVGDSGRRSVETAPGASSVVTLKSPFGPPGPTVMTGPGTLGVRSETWTLASGAAMVVTGVLAAVFRHQANDAAARYLETRDPRALSDVRQYDRLAGASMIAVQVSLGAFVLFLAGP